MKQQLTKRFTRSQLDNNNNHQVNNTKVVSKSNKRRQNSHKSNKVKGSAPSSKLKGRVKTRSQIANNNNQPIIESRQDDEDEELTEDNNKMSSIPSSTNHSASSATNNNNSDTKRANETLTSLKPPSNTTLSQQPKQKEVETPEQIAFRKSYPLTNISEPTNNDCLFGRGGGTNHHPGNKHYRSIVDSQKQRYLNSKRLDKPMVAMVSLLVFHSFVVSTVCFICIYILEIYCTSYAHSNTCLNIHLNTRNVSIQNHIGNYNQLACTISTR